MGGLPPYLKLRAHYDYLGQWVAPALAWSFWTLWAHSSQVKKLGFKNSGSQYMCINGHSLSEKGGLYGEIRDKVYSELIAKGTSPTARKIYNIAKDIERRTEILIEEYDAEKNYFKENSSKGINFNKRLIQKTYSDKKMHSYKAECSFLLRVFDLHEEAVFPWRAMFAIGDALERRIEQICREKGLDEKEVWAQMKDRKTMSLKDLDVLRKFKKDFIKYHIAREMNFKDIQKKYQKLSQKLLKYQEETEYVGTNQFWGEPRTMEKLLAAIHRMPPSPLLRKETSKHAIFVTSLGKQLSTYEGFPATGVSVLPSELQRMLDLASQARFWRLQLGSRFAQATYLLRPVLLKIARAHRMKYGDVIYASHVEIKEYIKNNKKLDKKKVGARKKKYMTVASSQGAGVDIVTGNIVDRLEQQFGLISKEQYGNVVIKGRTGYGGLVRGKAAVILSSQEMHRVTEDMILITAETTPDFIPAMNIARAFVTDHGGITSHAAIVAREMRKPCIIGTQNATRLIKSGDMVEVDAEKGIVKIITRR